MCCKIPLPGQQHLYTKGHRKLGKLDLHFGVCTGRSRDLIDNPAVVCALPHPVFRGAGEVLPGDQYSGQPSLAQTRGRMHELKCDIYCFWTYFLPSQATQGNNTMQTHRIFTAYSLFMRQVLICLRPRTPYPPSHCIRVYIILIHTEKGGAELNQREG